MPTEETRMAMIERCADLMAEGFRDDPGLLWQISELANGERIFKAQCKGEIEAFANLGLLRTEGDGGLLLGYTSEQAQTPEFAKEMTEGAKYLLQEATEQELVAMQSKAMQLVPITQPDWYVKFIGAAPVYTLQVVVVRAELRGTGVFRRLLTPLLEQCAGEQRTIVLQTHNPENVPKYEHFGFELKESLHSAETNITCHNLMKTPD